MSCSPFDLRDYFLKELPDPQQRQVEAHVQRLPRLPGRIGPAPPHPGGPVLAARRRNPAAHRVRLRPGIRTLPRAALVGRLLGIAGARLGFAGAAMLSAAMLFSASTRTAGRLARRALRRADVDRRIQAAVAASEARQTARTTQLVHDLVQRVDSEHKLRLVAESDAEYARKQDYMAQ